MKDPLDLSFPKRITLSLPEALRKGLELIADRERHDSDSELLLVVLARGIVTTLAPDEGVQPSAHQIAQNMNAAQERARQLQSKEASREARLTSKAMRVYPAPGVLYRAKHKEYDDAMREAQNQHESGIYQLQQDVGFAESPDEQRERGQTAPTPHRHVERFVACVLSEETRLRVEDFLGAHPDLDEEEALTTLLQRGLDQEDGHVEDGPETEGQRKATAMLCLAERLYLRARHRCLA